MNLIEFMKHLLLAVMSALWIFQSPAYSQQLTVNEAINIQNKVQTNAFAGRAEWNALTYYLQGVIEGIGGYKESLSETRQSILFCPPKAKNYSIEEFLIMLKHSMPEDRNRPASLVLIEAYTEKYPC